MFSWGVFRLAKFTGLKVIFLGFASDVFCKFNRNSSNPQQFKISQVKSDFYFPPRTFLCKFTLDHSKSSYDRLFFTTIMSMYFQRLAGEHAEDQMLMVFRMLPFYFIWFYCFCALKLYMCTHKTSLIKCFLIFTSKPL